MMIFPDNPSQKPMYLPSTSGAPATGLVPLSQAPSQSQSSFAEDDDMPTLSGLGTGSSSGFPSSVPSELPVRPTKRLNRRQRLCMILVVLVVLLGGGLLLLAASPQQPSTPQMPHLQPGATPPAAATPVQVVTTPIATPTQSPKDCLREAMRVIVTDLGGQSHCFSFRQQSTLFFNPPLRGIQMICSTVAVTVNDNASEDPSAAGSQNDLSVFVPSLHCEWTRPAIGKESMTITDIVLAQA